MDLSERMENVAVIGAAGKMGSGIALVAAQAGFQVVMRDIEERLVENGLGAIDRFLTRSLEKEKITEDEKNAVLGRITGTVSMRCTMEMFFPCQADPHRPAVGFH